jgi:hypothetical protein
MATPHAMSDIQPNSPEAKKLARKVSDLFLCIAAANIVLIAIVLWARGGKSEQPTTTATQTQTQTDTATPNATHDMEAALSSAIADYNAKDETRFAAHFSKKAEPPMDAHVFKNLIAGIYHDEFGDVLSKTLSPTESSADPDFGMLVYIVECKKRPKAKLSINFRRENGVMKIVQWRMEKL